MLDLPEVSATVLRFTPAPLGHPWIMGTGTAPHPLG